MALEVHISRVEQLDDHVVVVADANLWRDGLRIYEARQLALTLRRRRPMSRAEPDPEHPTRDDQAALPDGPPDLTPEPAYDPAAWRAMLLDLERACYVFRRGDRIAMTTAPAGYEGGSNHLPAELLAVVPPMREQQLGDPAFRARHGIQYAYAAGAMANGIASEELVIALGGAGMLSSFGAAGLAAGADRGRRSSASGRRCRAGRTPST